MARSIFAATPSIIGTTNNLYLRPLEENSVDIFTFRMNSILIHVAIYQAWFQNLETNIIFPPQPVLILEEDLGDLFQNSMAEDEILALYDVIVFLANDETVSNPSLHAMLSGAFNVPAINTVYDIHNIFQERQHEIYQSIAHVFLHGFDVFDCIPTQEDVNCSTYLQSKTTWIANRIENTGVSMGNRLIALITSQTLFLSGAAAVLNTLNEFGFLFSVTVEHNENRHRRLAQAEFNYYLLCYLHSPTSSEDALDIISSAFWIEYRFLHGEYFDAIHKFNN